MGRSSCERSRHGVIASRRWVIAGALLWFGPASAEQPSPPQVDADEALSRVFRETTAMVQLRRPWDDCRQHLANGLRAFTGSEHTDTCRRLLDSMARAAARGEVAIPPADAPCDPGVLVAGLHAAGVEARLVVVPLAYYPAFEMFSWEFHRQSTPQASADPAYRLYASGRQAIPALIETLDDLAATRTVATNDVYLRQPVVMRVNDVALALIEAISWCRFRDHAPRDRDSALISEWSPDDRAELITAVRAWWRETREMNAVDAVLWQMDQAEERPRLQMVDALIAAGEAEPALRYLVDHYRDGDTIDSQLASRVLRLGSRVPLDFVHEVALAGRPVDPTMVHLIIKHGATGDFRLLAELVDRSSCEVDVGAEAQVRLIVDVLRHTDEESRLHLPILMAAIDGYLRELDAGERTLTDLPTRSYVDAAAERVQALSGVNFGYDVSAPFPRRLRACKEMRRWWQVEGCGAYGYARLRPHAPSGIR